MPDERKRLEDLISSEKRRIDGRFAFLCRIVVSATGVIVMCYGVYDYIEHGHYLSALLFAISLGCLLLCVGIFTGVKICETIAEGIAIAVFGVVIGWVLNRL